MSLTDLNHEVEDKAVEYLNETRLGALEEMALYQLEKSANNGYVKLHKLEFSALLNAVRGLQRKRQRLEESLNHAVHQYHGVNCVKVPHGAKTGYLHGPDDDSPYDVDGCRYCGRCHIAL